MTLPPDLSGFFPGERSPSGLAMRHLIQEILVWPGGPTTASTTRKRTYWSQAPPRHWEGRATVSRTFSRRGISSSRMEEHP